MSQPFDKHTTVAEILKANPALIEVFDDWNLHLVPSTVVAMNAPLQKAANWHAIFNVDGLLDELNAKRDLAANQMPHHEGNGQLEL